MAPGKRKGIGKGGNRMRRGGGEREREENLRKIVTERRIKDGKEEWKEKKGNGKGTKAGGKLEPNFNFRFGG